jgi:hypothetical protein
MDDDVCGAQNPRQSENKRETEQRAAGAIFSVQKPPVKKGGEEEEGGQKALSNPPEPAGAFRGKEVGHPTQPWGGAGLPQQITQTRGDDDQDGPGSRALGPKQRKQRREAPEGAMNDGQGGPKILSAWKPLDEIRGRKLGKHRQLPDGAHDAQLKTRGMQRPHEEREGKTIGCGEPEHSEAPGQNVESHGANEFPFRKNGRRVGFFGRRVHA